MNGGELLWHIEDVAEKNIITLAIIEILIR